MKYVVVLKNLISGEIFEKEFDSPYQRNVFKTRCRYSNKVRCIGDCQRYGA